MRKYLSLKLILATLWLFFTLALATWWLLFGLRQAEKLGALDHLLATDLFKQQRMLLWEGGVLLLSLLLGGGALFYFILKERNRRKEISQFFSTFTHELKTSLTSLRIQAESLEEDFKTSHQNERLLERLISDTVRLELQLENSLFIAQLKTDQFHMEYISLSKLMTQLKYQWPKIKINLDKDCLIYSDARVLESVFKNIIQNSIIHGKATEIHFQPKTVENSELIKIFIADNGMGYKGERKNLGKLFVRPTNTSGTGIGLYLIETLLTKMGGKINLITPPYNQGFSLDITLKGIMKEPLGDSENSVG